MIQGKVGLRCEPRGILSLGPFFALTATLWPYAHLPCTQGKDPSLGKPTHLVRKSSVASLALSICRTSLAFSDLASKI